MTDTSRAGRSRRETDPETGRALADDAARLLDRLRNEPLPAGERTAAALRQATRHAFILVEETRKLAGAEAPARVVPFPGPRKKTIDRPVFFEPDRPAAAWKDSWQNRTDIDLETFCQRAGRAAALARPRA